MATCVPRADRDEGLGLIPLAGYRRITTTQLCTAWSAYQAKLLRYIDFRVYLALHEIHERRAVENRRRKLAGLRPCRYAYSIPRVLQELQPLVGGAGGRYLTSCVRRLSRVGLVRLDQGDLAFTPGPAAASELFATVNGMLERIHLDERISQRALPVPRQILQLLARSAPAAMAATVFGHLIRCVWAQQDGCTSIGSCSVSFVADLFGLHPRTVKRARRSLRDAGFLVPVDADRWHVQANGQRVQVNLVWRGRPIATGDPRGDTESPPPAGQKITELPPPYVKRELLSDSENQKPGVRKGADSRSTRWPTLTDITAADLQDARRTESLLRQATAAGWVGASACERLQFHTAAVHAVAGGVANPGGLFVYLVRDRHLDRLTLADDDSAKCEGMLQWGHDS